ncbi:MAG: T9SS type A sorting domain-containing protein [Ignavibacteriae bacterium]|nr:T9SS type A sorting domain-containing protein [Ignavibacteriota bacterium]
MKLFTKGSTIGVIILTLFSTTALIADHCEIHGKLLKGSSSGPGLAGWRIVKTPVERLGMDTVVTDANGNFSFRFLPGSTVYRIRPLLPAGWVPLDAIPGYTAVTGDGGEVSAVIRVNEMTLDIFVMNGTVCADNYFLVATVDDTTKYRTASMRDWAYELARDQKGKLKAVKCKPVINDFKLNLMVPEESTGTNRAATRLILKFNTSVEYLRVHKNKSKEDTVCVLSRKIDQKGKEWELDFNCPFPNDPPQVNQVIQIDGRVLKGKPVSVGYAWVKKGEPQIIVRGQLPGNQGVTPRDSLKPGLRPAMPNLVNVGECIYGGPRQTGVNIVVGIESKDPEGNGAHTVYHPKFKDVQKSLIKIKGQQLTFHDDPPRCLDNFDMNDKPISKRQKSLPPVKHNNSLFGEQLALKLNILASDSGCFPPGFGDLVYDNDTAPTPFDGKKIRVIMAQVDSFLTCNNFPKDSADPSVTLQVLKNINNAFNGPLDTVRWGCRKVVMKGVKPLFEVPYLHPNPSGASPVNISPESSFEFREPEAFALNQNYPNPFNPTTTIEFDLAKPALVTLKVFNTLGQEVATLLDHEEMDSGLEEVDFNASGLPSGIYFYRLIARPLAEESDKEGEVPVPEKDFVNVRKMILLK